MIIHANAEPADPRRRTLKPCSTGCLGVWGYLRRLLPGGVRHDCRTLQLYDVKRQPRHLPGPVGRVVAVRAAIRAAGDLDQAAALRPARSWPSRTGSSTHLGFNPWACCARRSTSHHRGSLPAARRTSSCPQPVPDLDQTTAQGQELILFVWLETHFSRSRILACISPGQFGGGLWHRAAPGFHQPASQLTLGDGGPAAARSKGRGATIRRNSERPPSAPPWCSTNGAHGVIPG